jgi:ECF sigma factor
LPGGAEQFAARDRLEAKLVEQRPFAGLSSEQAVECLDISLSSAARAWLYAAMAGDEFEKK